MCFPASERASVRACKRACIGVFILIVCLSLPTSSLYTQSIAYSHSVLQPPSLSFCIHARDHTHAEKPEDKQAQKRHSETQQSIRRTLLQANQKMQEHARDILGIKDSCMT